MKILRDSVYIIVAIGSIALAACQPSEADVDPQTSASANPQQQIALDLFKGSESPGQAIVTSAR